MITMSTLIINNEFVNKDLYPPGVVSSLFGGLSGEIIALEVHCLGARLGLKKS
jgi:hypothetical protein